MAHPSKCEVLELDTRASVVKSLLTDHRGDVSMKVKGKSHVNICRDVVSWRLLYPMPPLKH